MYIKSTTKGNLRALIEKHDRRDEELNCITPTSIKVTDYKRKYNETTKATQLLVSGTVL